MFRWWKKQRQKLRRMRVSYHQLAGISEGSRFARSSHMLDTALMVALSLLALEAVVAVALKAVVILFG